MDIYVICDEQVRFRTSCSENHLPPWISSCRISNSILAVIYVQSKIPNNWHDVEYQIDIENSNCCCGFLSPDSEKPGQDMVHLALCVMLRPVLL